jgi:hypothetical protein
LEWLLNDLQTCSEPSLMTFWSFSDADSVHV